MYTQLLFPIDFITFVLDLAKGYKNPNTFKMNYLHNEYI